MKNTCKALTVDKAERTKVIDLNRENIEITCSWFFIIFAIKSCLPFQRVHNKKAVLHGPACNVYFSRNAAAQKIVAM